MNYQAPGSRWKKIFTMIQTQGIGLAYFLGSQKELGPRLRAGEAVVGAPASDLDLGVVLLAHPLDFWEGQKLRQRRQDDLAPFFAPLRLHLLRLAEERPRSRCRHPGYPGLCGQ
jgi:hypothetical protein